MNPYDDGIGLDEYVDWLVDAGYPIDRVADYQEWLQRFETSMRALPDKQRQASLLPLLHSYAQPAKPLRGSFASTERFRTAVQEAKVGPDKDIPHVTRGDHRQVHHRPATARSAVTRFRSVKPLRRIIEIFAEELALMARAVTRSGNATSPARRASSTIAINGRIPCVMAARALSGDDTSSTSAAASMEPVPAKMSASPTS